MQKAKILIVDDNPNNRFSIRTILQSVDAELHEANNGFDALNMALKTNYALILLDEQLPNLGSYDVCKQLRADNHTADIPIIFLTGAFTENNDQLRGYKAGATDCLTKPLDEHILKAKVHIFLRIYQQHQQLQQNNADLKLAASVFESQQGILITDVNNIIIRVNKAFSAITLYSAEEVIGKKPNILKSGRHDENFYFGMWQSLKNFDAWQGEIWNRRKNGEIYPEWLNLSSVKNEGIVTHYIATMSDITNYKNAEDKIHQLAFYDPLTGLPNRRLLFERLQHGIERCSRDGVFLAVLMMDLDYFKAVNDTLGHLAGDQLLQQVAFRLLHRLRSSDMVARLGGDEFTIVLEGINHIDGAASVAEYIIDDLSKPFHLSINNKIEHQQEVHIGASIGISIYGEHGITPQSLMDKADAALYKAKKNGRNCFAYYSEELTLLALKRHKLESILKFIIENNKLLVHYQAQVDIATDKIIGAEALIRWDYSDKSFDSPTHLIQFAEETGFIVAIGNWILRETCRQGKQWLDAGLPPLVLAVNVSSHQFRHTNFVSTVSDVLRDTQFPATYLELEVTENGLMDNQEKTRLLLNGLRQLGVRLSIDDFGTGYSSLACLKHFPVNTLKIDNSFINEIPHNREDMAIAATIISTGRILGFDVLAEGVETQEQLAFLKEKGCNKYQGRIKSKPLPAYEFEQLLRKNLNK
ncbi:MAG: EAL domain-containing protein [Methylococcales bacterium]|nr:EAL domain-containing protein [Methylococcales bacterium]MDD5754233.1 EAL domain-containing protein [Methylococcales bacterium]